MARIKVTGYMDTDDLDPAHVDTSHEMGLSNKGYEHFTTGGRMRLEDAEFEMEQDDDEPEPVGPKKLKPNQRPKA